MKGKQKLLRLTDDDLETLEALREDLAKRTGVKATDSNVVSIALRRLKEQGGVLGQVAQEPRNEKAVGARRNR